MLTHITRQRLRLWAVILGVCFIAGCHQKQVQGDTSIYSFAIWVGPVIILAGLVAVPVGWLLRHKVERLAWVLMILGPLAVVFLGPAMFLDEARIDPQQFDMRTGFWFSPSRYRLRFDEVQQVRWVEKRGRRGSVNYSLECVLKNGQQHDIPVNDLMKGEAIEELLGRLRQRDVPIVGR